MLALLLSCSFCRGVARASLHADLPTSFGHCLILEPVLIWLSVFFLSTCVYFQQFEGSTF